MANIFKTPDIIAERLLPVLYEKTLLPELSFKDYSSEFVNVGDTISIKTPASFVASEWDGDSSNDYQDIVESTTTISMDSIVEVPVKVTSKQMTLDLEDFVTQIGNPAMEALAQKINAIGYQKMLAYAYQEVGSASSTPDALADLTGIRKLFQKNLAPNADRYVAMNYDAEEKFLQLDSLVEVDKSGTPAALREGILGRLYGMELYADGSVPTVAADAGFGSSAAVTGTAGGFTLTVASGVNAGTIKAGQLIDVDGGLTHVVTADATLDGSGVGTVSVYPAVPTGGYSSAATTIRAAHVANIAWQKNALAFVSRPLALPMGGATGSSMTFRGLNLRMTMDYDIDAKINKVVFDVLSGWKVLRPQHIIRLLG